MSAYNTGNYEQGFKNGYVARYFPKGGIKTGINRVAIKELQSGRTVLETSNKTVPRIAGLINRYKAELTIYSRDESLKVISSQAAAHVDVPFASISVTELPAEQSTVAGMCNQELLY